MTRGRTTPHPGILWMTRDASPPHNYLVDACKQAGEQVRELRWVEPEPGEKPLGRYIEIGAHGRDEHPMSFQAVSPRTLVKLIRAPEDVIVTYEFGLAGLYAGLSKLFRRGRRVVSLVENDYQHLGRTGTIAPKVIFRKLVARLMDGYVANNKPARDYLVNELGIPPERITLGWWLAGMPANFTGRLPEGLEPPPGDRPLFVCAGRLIPPKGVDLLLEAAAVYKREHGDFTLWLLGEGAERAALEAQAERLGIADEVVFAGKVDHAGFKGALDVCDAFVFPTLKDLTGRVVVEALTAGVPVVCSSLSGAAGTIVNDGVNGVIADPRDAEALAAAMWRAVEPGTRDKLRQGVEQSNGELFPEAGAEVIRKTVAAVRAGGRG